MLNVKFFWFQILNVSLSICLHTFKLVDALGRCEAPFSYSLKLFWFHSTYWTFSKDHYLYDFTWHSSCWHHSQTRGSPKWSITPFSHKCKIFHNWILWSSGSTNTFPTYLQLKFSLRQPWWARPVQSSLHLMVFFHPCGLLTCPWWHVAPQHHDMCTTNFGHLASWNVHV